MKVPSRYLFASLVAGFAALTIADDQMPNPGGGSNCYKIVNKDGCTLAGAGNTSVLVCPTSSSRLAVSSPSVPIAVGAGTGEAGKKDVQGEPNVYCKYKSGYPNTGGTGCTWIDTL